MSFLFDVAYAMAPAQEGDGQGSMFSLLFPFLLMFAVFYFLLIRPQKKQAEQHRKFLSELQKGDEVVTSGGVVGKVVGVTDNLVTLDVGEKIKIKVMKGNVSRAYTVTKQPAPATKAAN